MSSSILVSAPHSKSSSSALPKPVTLPRAALVLDRIGSPYKVNVQGASAQKYSVPSNLLPQIRTRGNSRCDFTAKGG